MSSRSRKRQSRLAFTPLPSSSPAAKGYHQQIQDRAAEVTYQGSSNPAKRRKMANDDGNRNGDVAFMPTPSTSMPQQSVEMADDSDEQPVQTTQKRRKRARQQRLDFEPTDGAVNLASPTGPTMFDKSRQLPTQEISSDESEELPSPGKLVRNSKKKSKSKGKDGFMGSKVKRVTRSSQKTPDQEDVEGDNIAVQQARKPSPVPIVDDDDDEEEDSEDQMPTTAGTQRRRRKQRESSFISSSPPAAAESDDDIQIIDKPKRKRTSSDQGDVDDEDEEDDVAPRTPGRRRLKARRNLTQQEQEDLDDDLEFLGPSSDVDESRAPRSTQSKAKNARLQALERLKQQRSSQRGLTQITEDDEEEGEDDRGDADDYDEAYDESEAEPAPTSSRAMFNADEEDDDFLVEEEEDGILGVPDGIPLAFTRYASMKAKELFKFAVDWMVQKKINPAFNMHDEIYDLTFKKLDDEVSGLVGSKFASSAWTPEFTLAVRSRPEIAYNRFSAMQAGDDFFHDKCDACNRSGHPATYEVQFQGKPYHRETLDEVANNDEEDDEDEDDDGDSSSSSSNNDNKPAYDAQGREIAPGSKIYFVGKFCMSNAKTAHALQHWRYHLYEWVVEWIDKHGYSTAKKLEKREKNRKKPKKLRKEANGILDRMVEEGVVKMLWHQFRDTIDEAANSKQGRYAAESP